MRKFIERQFDSPEQSLKYKQRDRVIENSNQEKLSRLADIQREVESITDRLGMPIDESIKDTVIMLNALDLPTSASCAGHADWGLAMPWVDIATPNEPEEKFVGQNEIFEKIARERSIDVDRVKAPQDPHEERLGQYRKEMWEFTNFLKRKYFHNDQEAIRFYETERRADFILKRLGLTWDDLRGKEVLDLGAGIAELAQAAKRRHIKVISVENDLKRYREEGQTIPEGVVYIETSADKLPLADSSFDLVISHAAPPIISDTKDEVRRM